MSRYWPTGLELSDLQSPFDILRDAQSDWRENSKGMMALILQKAVSNKGNDMIVVHAQHVASNRTAALFSVVCRKGYPYPARLQPKDDELPNVLKKRYKKEQSLLAYSLTSGGGSEIVTNDWVAETPAEFREKLASVFNLGSVKSEIINLVSSGPDEAELDSGPVFAASEQETRPADEPGETP